MSETNLGNPGVYPVILTDEQRAIADVAGARYRAGEYYTTDDIRAGRPLQGAHRYWLSELESALEGGGLSSEVCFAVSRVLRDRTGGEEQVTAKVRVNPPTLGAALLALAEDFPELSRAVLDEDCLVRRHVSIYWQDDDIRFLPRETEIGNGDTLHIIPAIAGGV